MQTELQKKYSLPKELQKNLIILSGPSGVGKTTIEKTLSLLSDDLEIVVSYTTRPKRDGEIEGKSYNFIDEQTFKKMVEEDKLIEHANYNNNYYGASFESVYNPLSNYKKVFIIVETKGKNQIIKYFPKATTIFLDADNDLLIKRMNKRGSETSHSLNNRINLANLEREQIPKYNKYIKDYDIYQDIYVKGFPLNVNETFLHIWTLIHTIK